MARGQVYMELEQWQEAAESLEQALAITVVNHPRHLHAFIAECYQNLGSHLLQDEHQRLASNSN